MNYPMKLMTTMCNTRCANMKSAKPRSALRPWNSLLFSGLTCRRRHTPRTKELTVEIKPLKNELKGKVPTRQQYTN